MPAHRTILSAHPMLVLGTLLALVTARPATAAVFTVGGAGCTHPDFQAALIAAVNNPGGDEIRLLANSQHQGQFLINSDNLTVRGGFASCSATSPTGFSTLLGTNTSRALFLNSFGIVVLERLSITGGSVTGDGGGLFVQGDGLVLLRDVLVFGNSATGRGGNVFVNASPGLEVHFQNASLVSAGNAADGGGIACSGNGKVLVRDETIVANNEASQDGGGVHLSASCELALSAGGPFGAGIVGNSVVDPGTGGGVYIEDGAELNTSLDQDGLARIAGNRAGYGGGVSVIGEGSVLRAFFAEITDNEATFFGGGVQVAVGGLAAIGRPFSGLDPCPEPARCALLRGNIAGLGGGAIFAIVDADVTVHGTTIEGNQASSGAAIDVRQTSTALIHSSVIAENDGPTPFSLQPPGGTLTLGNVTVARNINFGAGLITIGPGGAGPLRVLTSIFDQSSGPLFGFVAAGSSIQLDCVLGRTAAFFGALPAGTVTRQIMTADPRLANPAQGNYQLRSNSPAIDVCDLTQWSGGEYDIDGQTRDIDNAIVNLLGSRDLGADEYLHVFADGFESGTTGRWDATVN